MPVRSDHQKGRSTSDATAGAAAPWTDSLRTLGLAVVLGGVFGFLLQKGGVAKFDILIGVLLLQDFTVVKVMLSAIVVGMLGVPILTRLGVLQLDIKETVLGANIVGGLVFGVGFGLLAYCPGTDAAAVGQGNLDALVGIVGMVVGSYLFALTPRFTSGRLLRAGDFGKLRLADLVNVPNWLVAVIGAVVLTGVLIGLEYTVG